MADISGTMPAGGVAMPGMQPTPVDAGQGQDDGGAAAGGQVPPESSDQRAGMPKPAVLLVRTERMRMTAKAHDRRPVYGKDSNVPAAHRQPHGLYADPVHVGARRFLPIDKDAPIEEETS
jgi:hypothetical protein